MKMVREMRKQGKAYLQFLETTKEVSISSLEVHIQRFQHERLVHLIVTGIMSLLFFLTFFAAIFFETGTLWLLCLPLFILMTAYLLHYYFLENLVQKLYQIYDQKEGKYELSGQNGRTNKTL